MIGRHRATSLCSSFDLDVSARSRLLSRASHPLARCNPMLYMAVSCQWSLLMHIGGVVGYSRCSYIFFSRDILYWSFDIPFFDLRNFLVFFTYCSQSVPSYYQRKSGSILSFTFFIALRVSSFPSFKSSNPFSFALSLYICPHQHSSAYQSQLLASFETSFSFSRQHLTVHTGT